MFIFLKAPSASADGAFFWTVRSATRAAQGTHSRMMKKSGQLFHKALGASVVAPIPTNNELPLLSISQSPAHAASTHYYVSVSECAVMHPSESRDIQEDISEDLLFSVLLCEPVLTRVDST